jgi:regulator of sigma E protease
MSMPDLLSLLFVILQVAVALGMVIFVHELGHFAVAKWCGVKCEKFYLGFDIYGLKLFKKQWGETEYGIGILPLGGYVKMLGQDDNPGKAAAERERSQLAPAGSADEPAQLDPRSYLAKSVPQRMAIISAGVIMNVIFAFVCAVWAFGLGVTETACGVSAVMPGEPAWQSDLQPGDRVLKIDDYGGPLRFRDLMSAVALGDLAKGVDFTIQREGVSEPFTINIKPDIRDGRLVPMIGVASPQTTTLHEEAFALGGTPVANAGKFRAGDQIVAVDGTPVKTYAQLVRQLTEHPEKELTFTVERRLETEADAPPKTEQLEIAVAPRPMRTLGLVMTMGEITAVQMGSPAAEAGLRPGDLIETIDGQQPGDPLRLAEELRKRAGQKISLVVARRDDAGKTEQLTKEITLRDRPWPEESLTLGSPESIPSLGVTYKVLATVREVIPDSPAAKAQLTKNGKPAAGFAAGDKIVAARLEIPQPSDEERAKREADPGIQWLNSTNEAIKFSPKDLNWPSFMVNVQQAPPGSKVTLELEDGRTASLAPVEMPEWFYYDRGFRFGPDETVIRAEDFSQAISLGAYETKDALLTVYKFLRRLGTRQVSPFALGGPVTIARAAGSEASQGFSRLLLFLTMLSANLAVINFLPIPLLDGGHMVFLILEGIMRRPVSEKVVIAFHYAGFLFIISLMLFVLSLDVGLIPRF